jgi:hypothetical protein
MQALELVRGDLQQIAGQCGRSLSGLHLVRPAGGFRQVSRQLVIGRRIGVEQRL